QRLQLDIEQLQAVQNRARTRSLHFIVTIFSVGLVDLAETLSCDAYKTASPDIIHRPLIEALMATRQPHIISAGASTRDEVRCVTKWLGDHPHLLMQCVS